MNQIRRNQNNAKEVKVVAVPEEQRMEIMKTFNSPRNAEAYYEMFQASNADYLNFETGNQIEGATTIEDYAGRVLK